MSESIRVVGGFLMVLAGSVALLRNDSSQDDVTRIGAYMFICTGLLLIASAG